MATKIFKLKSPLCILHLEDDANDAVLVRTTLEAEGITCAITCVHNKEDLLLALERGGIDLILSDSSMPSIDWSSAMKVLRAKWPAIPFIIVSGAMGEERAIDSLKKGATDYVLKERLTRLAPAVRRAMREVEELTRCRRLEQELILQSMAVKNAANAIIITDPRGAILWTNPAFTALTGFSEREAIGKTPRILKSGQHDLAFYENLWRTILSGETWRGEFTNHRKNGGVYVGEETITPVYSPDGKLTHFIGIMNDVSEKKRLEAQFIEAQKMEVIGQLAGGVAHDFNNILAVIMGYADLMTIDISPEDPGHPYIEEIRLAAERAAALTRQLLVFSRNETVQPVVLDLNSVVVELEKMLRRLIGENIEMTALPGVKAGRIKADAGHIGQVMMNLIVNARDAMPQGGKIIIATKNVTLDKNQVGATPGDYVMLSVKDTGTGMTEDVKTRLFEAFFTTKPVGKGTGLGLATCQTIVQQCGGHIAVESEIGHGTTFKIYFPRVDEALDFDTKLISAGPMPRGTETLLIVEDEPSLRHLAHGVLLAQGYTVLRASNGQDALHVAREHKGSPIRLVISDVVMPLMGGKVMAEWLKTTIPDLKILFTSGYTDDAIIHGGALESGVAFLPKPYTPAFLARKVREMLDAESDTAHKRKQEATAQGIAPVPG